MVLGTCVICRPQDRPVGLPPESITITGEQDGFLLHFVVKQVFRHFSSTAEDVRYIVPNNSKICMYGTTFRIGSEEVLIELTEKTAAKEVFEEAKSEGRAALLSEMIGDGLVQFSLGNLPPNDPCEISVHFAFTASSSGPSSTFFKFPLQVCTPGGTVECVSSGFNGIFDFSLRNTSPSSVCDIATNVESNYDGSSGILRINSAPSVGSILVTTTLRESIGHVGVRAGRFIAATFYIPRAPEKALENNEFIFVIDCSGSMSGQRIKQARLCLSLFIRSLPPCSFFNIVRFGSNFEMLFPEAVKYDEKSSKRALELAGVLQANLGGTKIDGPLQSVFMQPRKGRGVRQLFVITDGEVSNTDSVIDLCRSNSNANRCFTIGLGSGADAGLVEGIANATGGRSDFVIGDDDLSGKVIGQLEASLLPGMSDVRVEVAGHDGIEFAPFPLPSLFPMIAQTIIGAGSESIGETQVLISGDFGGSHVDEVICLRETALNESILRALFAFETIGTLERVKGSDSTSTSADRVRLVRLSIESGVLCSATAFVGFSPLQRKFFDEVECAQASPRLYELRESAGRGDVKPRAATGGIRMKEGVRLSFSRGTVERSGAQPRCFSAAESTLPPYPAPTARACMARPPPPPLRSAAPPPPPPRSARKARARPLAPPGVEAPAERTASSGIEPTQGASPSTATAGGRVDQMLALVSLQSFEGFWSDVENISRVSGMKINRPSDLKGQPACLATAIAIALLRKEFGDLRSQWQMIERKALGWLSGQVEDAEALISLVLNFV
jgi:hypothetical protein